MQSVPQVQNPPQPMHGIFNGDSSNNAMNLIAFFQEQFGEICPSCPVMQAINARVIPFALLSQLNA